MAASSALVSRGEITRQSKTALIKFEGSDVEYVVGVVIYHMPSGGFWGRFLCSRCGGPSHRIRLFDGRPTCAKCVQASGLIYRSQSIRTEKRHAVTAPRRLAMLNRDTPMRAHSSCKLERRSSMEARLRRSLIVARRYSLSQYEKSLK